VPLAPPGVCLFLQKAGIDQVESMNLDFKKVWPDQNRVMKMLDCSEDNPTFQTLIQLNRAVICVKSF